MPKFYSKGRSKYGKRKRGFRKLKGYSKRKRGSRTNIPALVKNVMRRQAETKYINFTTGQLNVGAATASTAFSNATMSYEMVLGPQNASCLIAQGTNVSQRIGNKIRTKELKLRMIVTAAPAGSINGTPRPFFLIVYFGYKKETPNKLPSLSTLGYDQFYTNGNQDIEAGGTVMDTFYHENKDKWVILKKDIIKCGTQNSHHVYYPNSQQAQNEYQYFANNDFKSVVRRNYDLTKHYPRVIKYDDAVTTPSLTRGLYMWCEAVDCTGNRYEGFPARIYIEHKYSYTDI